MSLRLALLAALWRRPSSAALEEYNVLWRDLIPDSNGMWTNTMPIGNGNMAANVWMDNATGTLSLLVSKADAWNEAAELMKLGLVSLTFQPNPFRGSFRQELLLSEAAVEFQVGSMLLKAYVDATSNILVVDVKGTQSFDISVSSTAVRSEPVTYKPAFECDSYTVSADVVTTGESALFVYHRNADDGASGYFRRTLTVENIDTTEMLETVQDPLTNLTTGIATFSSDLMVQGTTLAGSGFSAVRVGIVAEQLHDDTPHASGWLRAAKKLTAEGIPAKDAHDAWWSAFWNRSAVLVGSDEQRRTRCNDPAMIPPVQPWTCSVFGCTCQGMADYYGVEHGVTWGCAPMEAQNWWTNDMNCQVDAQSAAYAGCYSTYCTDEFLISRQYILERYLQAIQARSPFPIKFNGMLFTAQKPPHVDDRQWGGHNWWQNWRLPYYNMLAAGDTDLLETMFQFFTNTLDLAVLRTKAYYDFSEPGAAFWPEYTSMFGTTHPDSYGCGRAGVTTPPIAYSADPWNHYNLQGILDAALLLFDHYSYTLDLVLFKRHFPFVKAALEFFRQRWQANGLDSDGKLIIYPTQAVETWQCPGYPPDPKSCATNDMPTVAGLQAVLRRVSSLPASIARELTSEDILAKWREFETIVPPLPGLAQGKLQPCAKCPAGTSNVQNPELYAVHPYRILTKASGNVDAAIAAFQQMRFPSDVGWNQVAMDAALLGLTTDAQRYVRARASTPPAKGYRFPAFMPHEQDYPPSSDHLAVFSNALTYMLLQTVNDVAGSVLLLPSWPCEWDVTFDLHAPCNTRISGSLRNGSLSFSVTPPTRASAVRSERCSPAQVITLVV